MKIPLQFSKNQSRIFSDAVLNCKHCRTGLARLTFAIDTGSPFTLISIADAERLKLPISNLPLNEPERHTRIGASTVELKRIPPTDIYLKNDKNQSVKINCNHLLVGIPTQKDEKTKQVAYSLPSLLGVDFLENNKFSLHFTPHKEEAYLQKDDEDN